MFPKSARIFFAMTIATVALTGCDDLQQREAKYKKRGTDYVAEKKYDLARVEFKNAAKINPTDPEVYYKLGLIDEAQGDMKNAYSLFSKAESQDKNYSPALVKIAQYMISAEQYSEASARLNTVIAREPSNADAHALRASMLMRHQEYAEAEREARLAMAEDPGNISAIWVMAGLNLAQGNPKAAEAVLDAGIARKPTEPFLVLLKIALYQNQNDIAQLELAYQALFRLVPTDQQHRGELASLYVKTGRLDDAEAVWRAGVAAAPESWKMKEALVVFLSAHRGLEPAEGEVRRFMAAHPDNHDLLFWLADLYLKHDATDRAVALLEKVAVTEKLESEGLNARASLARINFTRGDRAVAEKLIAVVLQQNPDHREALFMRASMAFDQGRFQSVVSDLRTILRDKPKSPEALRLLAEALLRQGRPDLASETLSQLVEFQPGDAAAQVRMAQLIQLNGDSARALEILTRVTRADPRYAIGWENLVRNLIGTHDWAAAEAAAVRLENLGAQQALTATHLRGESLVAQGKPAESIALFTQVVSADPGTPLAEYSLSALVRVSIALGRLPETITFIEGLKSDNPFVATVLGECYQGVGRADAAELEFDKAVAAGPARPEPYLNLARVQALARKIDPAIEVLRRGAVAVPGDVRIPLMLADLLGERGRHQDAIALYDDLLTRNPSLDRAANNLAAMIADYQYTDPVALERARRAAERFQGATDPVLIDTLGWVQYRLGNVPQAVTLLGRAVGTGDAPAQFRFHYGAALLKADMKEQAKAQLEAATAKGANYPGIEEAKKLLASL
jgi:tetratricopeptide (TPR) repeat protein